MAITDAEIIGYRGTVDEVAYAMLSAVPEGRVGGEGDWLVTGVPGSRRISVALGRGKHAGVLAITDRAYVRDVPTPAAGQWFLAVATRTWHRDGVPAREFDFRLVAGPTTTQDVPAAPPLLLPGTLANEPGRELDQVLAWVWVAANRTDVLTWDWRHDRARPFAGRKGLGWAGPDPQFPISFYSISAGVVHVEQRLVIANTNGLTVGQQVKRPFVAAPGGEELLQEGSGAVFRPGGDAHTLGMTTGRTPDAANEIRFDLSLAGGRDYVGQANTDNIRPFRNGWQAGDRINYRYSYRPVWPLTPTP